MNQLALVDDGNDRVSASVRRSALKTPNAVVRQCVSAYIGTHCTDSPADAEKNGQCVTDAVNAQTPSGRCRHCAGPLWVISRMCANDCLNPDAKPPVAPTHTETNSGPCARCHKPTTRYGDHGNPLCQSCRHPGVDHLRRAHATSPLMRKARP